MLKRNFSKCFQLFLLALILSSCAHKTTEVELQKLNHHLSDDTFALEGTYSWSFQLMGNEQVSKHTFYPDSINYQMEGPIHSTEYVMNKISFNSQEKKWIGEDHDKVVYVLFIDEASDSTMSIYKHKCKTDGLQEAIGFKRPLPNATEDHGWNTYSNKEASSEEQLPVSGGFACEEQHVLIKDEAFRIDDKVIKKLSFHTGERRWVGSHEDKYLQVFFKSLNNQDSFELSVTWFDKIDLLYKTKYHEVNNWKIYHRTDQNMTEPDLAS